MIMITHTSALIVGSMLGNKASAEMKTDTEYCVIVLLLNILKPTAWVNQSAMHFCYIL